MNIPFDEIKDTLDRSWSDRLMSLIESAATDEVVAQYACDALSELADPANTDRLFAFATDGSQDVALRARALNVICDSGLSLEGDALRAWWNSGDPILQKEALEEAYRTEADYVRPVASDPLHPMYKHAITALEVGFDDAEWQSYIVDALSHFDPTVQMLAAGIVVWEEPIAAQARLIDLANGDSTDLALRAIQSRRYFRSRDSLQALDALAHHSDGIRAYEAQLSAEGLAHDFQTELNKAESKASRDALTKWMGSLIDKVTTSGVDRSVDTIPNFHPEPFPLPIHGQSVVAALSDLNGCWNEKMQWLKYGDWSHESPSDRALLSDCLVQHVDPSVRKYAARILAEWNDVDAVLTLTHDRYVMVRNEAVFRLRSVSPSAEVAKTVWPFLAEDKLGGWFAREALDSWLKHVPDDPTERLVDIALNDSRQGLRWSTVNALGASKAGLIVSLLDNSPDINWSIHALLLENLGESGARPSNLQDFAEVDDLRIAAAYAKFMV
jgi:hypothetical protein